MFDGGRGRHHRRPARRLRRRFRPDPRHQHHAGAGAALRGPHRTRRCTASRRSSWRRCAASSPTRRWQPMAGALPRDAAARLRAPPTRWLLRLATPLYLLRLACGGAGVPSRLYRQALGERLGCYRGAPASAGRVWLHAVSLGETRAAAALVDALRQQPARHAAAADPRHRHRARSRSRAAAPGDRRPGCPTTRRARCGASCATTARGWAC